MESERDFSVAHLKRTMWALEALNLNNDFPLALVHLKVHQARRRRCQCGRVGRLVRSPWKTMRGFRFINDPVLQTWPPKNQGIRNCSTLSMLLVHKNNPIDSAKNMDTAKKRLFFGLRPGSWWANEQWMANNFLTTWRTSEQQGEGWAPTSCWKETYHFSRHYFWTNLRNSFQAGPNG